MKPVIEANFKPFESVRFRQNASLVSKDQLAALTIMGCIPFREVNLNFVWHLAIWNTYQPWK